MKATIYNKVIEGDNGTVEMEHNDHLSIAYKDPGGMLRVVTVQLRGYVCIVTDELTCTGLHIRPSKTEVIRG